jgi:tRNA A-37 threonylcarbamoyl transferase component Bud32
MPAGGDNRTPAHPFPRGKGWRRRARKTEPVQTLGTRYGGGDAPAREDGEVVLGRYRLVRRIGAGGFGVVWLAEDLKLHRAVAVKRIVLADAATAARAEREARAAARLSHPAIVALYESGSDDEAVYLVSELVRGRSLAELERDGLLSDRDVLRAGIALCDGLGHAHRRGVVHRDVKPANVIVPDDPAQGGGVVKLTDFGIAHMTGDDALTATGDVVGTLAYMAPEQAEGRAVDARTDLYALALVLYEALAGINPVRGRGAASTARRVGARLPPLGRVRRDLPGALCAAVDAAVLPRPEDRGTLAELRAELVAAVDAVGDDAGTIAGSALEGLGAAPLARRPTPLRARLAAAAGAGALTAAALAWLGPPPPVPAPAGGALAAAAVLLLPLLGWLAAAASLATWLAVVVAVAALPALERLRRAPVLLSAPAGAPVLGLAALAAAWPAVAGQAPRAGARAALALLGCWWLLLAEVAAGDRLLLGPPPGASPTAEWRTSAGDALAHAVWPVVASGGLLVGLVWAVAAVLLPLVVRGRAFALDLVGAVAWAAATAAATQALTGILTWDGRAPAVRGAVAGAALAGAIAVAARAFGPARPAPVGRERLGSP